MMILSIWFKNFIISLRFYPYEYTSDFKKFKEELFSKERFYSSLAGKKTSDKEY